jgi:3',5'-nucleoside bisphosphate phosphatase
MNFYRADLHIHTVLSPCGDLDMSPKNIISAALEKGLGIIGITDHNSTRHCNLIERMASEKGLFVMKGAEVTTKEEVHCLAFFENTDALDKFQEFLDHNLPDILNEPSKFGYQVQVDENENIIFEEKRLLINGISQSFEATESFVHKLDGIFIPAHINRRKNSIYSQLGFLPAGMKADAVEVSMISGGDQFILDHPEIKQFPIIRSSDAHLPVDIGRASTLFLLKDPSFAEIRLALRNENGRKTIEE